MIKIYYHLAVMNDWRNITDFFFESVISSRLYEKCDSLDVVFVGSGEKPKFNYSDLSKINLTYGGELDAFEFPTLQKLWKECLDQDCDIFYFHSKGSSFDPIRWGHHEETIKRQYACRKYQKYSDVQSAYSHTRRWLRRCLIDRFEDCLMRLDANDVVCLAHKEKSRFFPSNFWWSKSSYVKSLGYPIMRKDRYDAEMWPFKEHARIDSIIGEADEYDLFLL